MKRHLHIPTKILSEFASKTEFLRKSTLKKYHLRMSKNQLMQSFPRKRIILIEFRYLHQKLKIFGNLPFKETIYWLLWENVISSKGQCLWIKFWRKAKNIAVIWLNMPRAFICRNFVIQHRFFFLRRLDLPSCLRKHWNLRNQVL